MLLFGVLAAVLLKPVTLRTGLQLGDSVKDAAAAAGPANAGPAADYA